MRPEDILDTLGDIDDSLLLQAEMPMRRRSHRGLITVIAAAMLICVSVIPFALSRTDEPVTPPNVPSQMLDAEVLNPDDIVESDKASYDKESTDASYIESDIIYEDSSFPSSESKNEEIFEQTSREEASFGESSFEDSSVFPPESSEAPPESSDAPPESSEIPPESSEEPPESSEEPPESSEEPPEIDNSSSAGDDVPYDGPIYKGYGYVEGDLPDTEEEPINYLGTFDSETSEWLNSAFIWTIKKDNQIEPSIEGSNYDCWLHLEAMGYNIYPVMSFKSTDYTKDIAIYKHSTKDEYILRSGNSLYEIGRSRVKYIRNLIDYHDGP